MPLQAEAGQHSKSGYKMKLDVLDVSLEFSESVQVTYFFFCWSDMEQEILSLKNYCDAASIINLDTFGN